MSGTSAVRESTLKMKNVKCWKMQGRGCVNVLEHYERITKLIRHLEVLSTIILCHCLSFQYNLLKISVEYINQMLRSTFKTSRRKPFSVLTLEVFFYQLQGGRMVTCLPSAIVTILCHLQSPLFHSERLLIYLHILTLKNLPSVCFSVADPSYPKVYGGVWWASSRSCVYISSLKPVVRIPLY